jgi:hypothetical protein
MGPVSHDDPKLREAWSARPQEVRDRAGCPDPERFWAALTLELPRTERAALIDHVQSCARCAESWRLTAELVERPAAARGARPSALRYLPIAATLAVMVVSGWIVLHQTPGRRSPDVEVRSRIEDRQPLPRNAFVLEWTPGPAGTIYDVEVGTSDLRSVTRAYALTAPRFTVPAAALTDLPAGTEIVWRVQATLPDGRVVSSMTYLTSIR